MKKNDKILFAIFKHSIHLGNAYGRTKKDAIKVYLKQTYSIQLPNITIKEILLFVEINEFQAIKAIEQVHYFKSRFLTDE